MRQLVKAKNNLMNAELYAVEPAVNKDGRKLTCVSIVSSYRPYTSSCRVGSYHAIYTGFSPSAESMIYERELAGSSARGHCAFEFKFNDHYYGWVQTPYHLEGRCQH